MVVEGETMHSSDRNESDERALWGWAAVVILEAVQLQLRRARTA